ncbi:hypothetical protein CCAX7_006380 [Capsulimonas corticalis]|uniref:Uncharacterized protein n=1 Tax=Capsulimonas corticalis TaxID=2219043 RepID=A0A402D3B3_9BACT|nr:hypothetical protein [Capsulimonas corticalis]BDI28587.1 hypothetical protein CCAX7_006380 [Capsulimonas corticalis]
MTHTKKTAWAIRLALLAALAASGCSHSQNPGGKISSEQIQAMSGRPPTADELRRSQESEARAVIPPTGTGK